MKTKWMLKETVMVAFILIAATHFSSAQTNSDNYNARHCDL